LIGGIAGHSNNAKIDSCTVANTIISNIGQEGSTSAMTPKMGKIVGDTWNASVWYANALNNVTLNKGTLTGTSQLKYFGAVTFVWFPTAIANEWYQYIGKEASIDYKY